MSKLVLCVAFLFLIVESIAVFGQSGNYPPEIAASEKRVYKTTAETDLNLWIFNPKDHKASEKRAAIVFFFGGGWRAGTPTQFVYHCQYLAGRGMVAMVADYRVRSRHKVLAEKCVADAKSAVRWIRENSAELGIDPDHIAAGGGSAGGHLAAATAILPTMDEPYENQSISSKPDALVLFNPAVTIEEIPGIWKPEKGRYTERIEGEPRAISPYFHITAAVAPTIIFHGTADSTVLFATVEAFTRRMHEKGNRCELVGYKDEGHGFFNVGRKNNATLIDTVNRMDAFLVSIGYLTPVPETTLLQ